MKFDRTRQIVVSSWRTVPVNAVADMPATMADLSFANPAIPKMKAMGLEIKEGTPTHFQHFILNDGVLIVPRHYKPALKEEVSLDEVTLTKYNIGEPQFKTYVSPKDDIQDEALEWLSKPLDGRLMLNAGRGKTTISLMAIEQIGIWPVLIIVHRQGLLEQWIERIEADTDIERKDIGIIQGPNIDFIGKMITVAMMQTLALGEIRNPNKWKVLKAHMKGGLAIYDELDVFPAEKMGVALSMFDCMRWGLTATRRHDGLQPILEHHIGPRELYINQYDLNPTIILCRIEVPMFCDKFKNHQKIISYIENREEWYIRGLRILARSLQRKGRKTAILMMRVNAIRNLGRRLVADGLKGVGIIIGKTPRAMKTDIFRASEIAVATRSILSRGMDAPDLDTIMTPPTSDPALAEQIVGRALRERPGKMKPLIIITIPWRDDQKGSLILFSKIADKMIKSLKRLGFGKDDNLKEMTIRMTDQ